VADGKNAVPTGLKPFSWAVIPFAAELVNVFLCIDIAHVSANPVKFGNVMRFGGFRVMTNRA
jgi:hypothetical protein